MKAKNNLSRKIVVTAVTLAFFTTLSGITIDLTNDAIKQWLGDHGVKAPLLVGALVLISSILLCIAYLQAKYSQPVGQNPGDIEPVAENVEFDTKRFVDSLKERYQNRYRNKLDGRFEISLEVNENFDPPRHHLVTNRVRGNQAEPKAFEFMQGVFERKGRLLIVGNPGIGKTVLLLRLSLALLNRFKDLERGPFPVIFNCVSWSPDFEQFGDWLNTLLVSEYGLSKTFAGTLLEQQRIVFLLDGLDELARGETKEIASEKRAQFLASLNTYLCDRRRAVICCRVEEFKQMKEMTAQDAPVLAKVEVLDLTQTQVLSALEQAEGDTDFKHYTAAINVMRLLESPNGGSLLEVLCTPFYFTIAMEIYDQVIPNKEDLPKTVPGIKEYMMGKFVERKIAGVKNQYDIEGTKMRRWLQWLAQFLENKHQTAFELTDLQPTDLGRPAYFRIVDGLLISVQTGSLYALLMALISGVFVGLCVAPFVDRDTAFSIGLLIGILMGLLGGTLFGIFQFLIRTVFHDSVLSLTTRLGAVTSREIESEDVSELRFFRGVTFAGLIYDAKAGRLGLISSALYLLVFGLFFSLAFGFFTGALFAFCLFWTIGLNQHRFIKKFLNTTTAYERLLSGFGPRFITNIFTYQVITVAVLALTQEAGITIMTCLLMLVCGVAVACLTSPLFRHLYLRFCFHLQGAMPLKYVVFLDCMASARILEKDGGRWRFWHQAVQEYCSHLEH